MAMDIFSQSRGLVTGLLLGVCITYFLLAISNTIPSKPYDGFTTLANLSDDSNTRSIVLKHTNFTYHGSPLRGVEGVQSRTEIDNRYYQVLENLDCKKEGISVPKCKQLALLVVLWEASDILGLRNSSHDLFEKIDVPPSGVPRAPHLENCTASVETNKMLDAWGTNGGCADWMLLKNQFLGLKQNADRIEDELADHRRTVKGSYPPWVKGADEDNLPLTRQVQRDIWLHQHPKNCQDPKLRFLLTDWEIDTGFGMGAQFASMTGMLAIALNEGRVLVTNHLNRADHDGCVGSARSHWSCYFFLETSQECRDHALLLASQPNAWNQGLITDKNNYTSRQIWAGKVPKSWGKPWAQMQPTTEIDGKLLLHHKASDRRWWRAQALRYLMRFPSKYTCSLLNIARHRAFGYKAAIMVLESLPIDWPQVAWIRNDTEIEHFVWDAHRPWVPRPLLSIHVRQGDKAGEMKIFYFQSYMALAQKLRNRFPQVRNVWLSTEMQDVIEESKSFTSWDFYFTKVTRQVGNMSMPEYEASIGRQVSTNYPLVNFLMAADADFFIGALGSTWCYLIDGMRTTGGKVMAGYLSVNKYRFW